MTRQKCPGPVRHELVGDNAPSVRSGDDPAMLGSATLRPLNPVEARSYQTFVLTYTVGKLGLDDTGGIRVAFRFISDAGKPQIDDPRAENYVTASCTGGGTITLSVDRNGGLRPWKLVVTARLNGGYLSEGEEITIVFGDTRDGSAGMLIQTFAEEGYEFRVMADVQATGNFYPLDQQFSVPVIAGPAHRWRAVLPSLCRPGETFRLGLKAEDVWGNPTPQVAGRVRFEPTLPVNGLPKEFAYVPDDRALTIEELSADVEGVLRIKVFVDGDEVAEAGPLVIRSSDVAGFWGDLHGQTGETVGTNSVESYFDFARNKAFLDISSHQANDFQINAKLWNRINELTAEYDEPGRFVAIPGYEWSGNTAVGGDHNVFFRHEGRAIRRCSHALLEDRSALRTDANTLTDLFSALKDEDCILYAHVGGRYANIHFDHDPCLETAVEMHSAWGTFEWILTDSLKLGRRVGVVSNSDGHKGRPGASYPGSSTFGAYGGLTCFLMGSLDRDSVFEAMRRRHHYGTTGCRMHLDVGVTFPTKSTLFERDPNAVADPPHHRVDKVVMGDIVQTNAETVDLNCEVVAHSGIERIEIRNGETVLDTVRPYARDDLGNRIRVLWSGAEYRGRGRNTTWRGRARISHAVIDRIEIINLWNQERLFEQHGSNTVVWDTVTTGNFMGFDVWLNAGADSELTIATNHGDLEVSLGDIGSEDIVLEVGGLERRLRVFRLPDEPLDRELKFRCAVDLNKAGDNPIWVCVTTEDGHQAWSSPIYIFK